MMIQMMNLREYLNIWRGLFGIITFAVMLEMRVTQLRIFLSFIIKIQYTSSRYICMLTRGVPNYAKKYYSIKMKVLMGS